MKKKDNKQEQAINPSYDKSLSVKERVADFLGAYHIELNGVVAHEPFMLTNEGKPDERCDTAAKQAIIQFVEKIAINK